MEKEFNFEQFKKSVDNVDLKRDVARILDDELAYRGIDWRKFYRGDAEATQKAASLLETYGISISTNELKTRAASLTAEDIKEAPVIALANEGNENMIDYVQNLRGDELKKYIVRMVDTLKVAERQTMPGALALQVYSSGIVAVGATWGIATLTAYMSGAVGMAAVIQGLTIATVATAVSAIVVVLLLIFIPFLVFMEKKAEIMGLVINRTKCDLKVKDIYLAHGKMVSLSAVEDKKHLPQKIFCPASSYIEIPQNDTTYSIEYAYAGFIYASKCDYALIGVEGALQFELVNGINPLPNGFYVGFSVPLSVGSNKCGISTASHSGAKEYFDKESDQFSVEPKATYQSTVKLEARVNSSSGGEVYMVASIQEKHL